MHSRTLVFTKLYELEKVQRRATKLIPELRDLDYTQRLSRLELSDLRSRRLRGDLIQMYKVANKYEHVEFNKGINYSLNTKSVDRRYELRRNCHCLTREQVKNCLPRFNFFTNRIVNVWIKLPEDVVNAKNLNSFKAKHDVWILKQKEATATAP